MRRGLTDVAIGCAGIGAILDLRGSNDTYGREMLVTEVAVVDELASAGELVMGKATGVPVAIVRGVPSDWFRRGDVRTEIIRKPERRPLPLSASTPRVRSSMRGATILVSILLLTASCTSGGTTGPNGAGSSGPVSSRKPNVLFVLTDDMRFDDLQYMPQVRDSSATRA